MTEAFGRAARSRSPSGPSGGSSGSGNGRSLVRRVAARRPGWRGLLITGGVVMVVYYGMVVASVRSNDAGAVALDDHGLAHPSDRVTLEVQAASLDPATGSLDIRIRPVPHGSLEGDLDGQLAERLQVQVTSPGEPSSSYDFPADQVVDPVGASVSATTQARSFPFDRPRSAFLLEVLDGDRHHVPADVTMVDETGDWELQAAARESRRSRDAGAGRQAGGSGDSREAGEIEGAGGAGGAGRSEGSAGSAGSRGSGEAGREARRDAGALRVQVDAHREPLAVGMALLFIVGIAVVGLITVAIVGGSLVRRQVDFDRVIWLGAMLVAIPAVRNDMPGVPPVGTSVDLWIVFPSVVVVTLALLASIVVVALNEAAPEDEPAPADASTGGGGIVADDIAAGGGTGGWSTSG